MAGVLVWFWSGLLNGNGCGLRALIALVDLELHLLTIIKISEVFALDSGAVDKYIRATLESDKTLALAGDDQQKEAIRPRSTDVR